MRNGDTLHGDMNRFLERHIGGSTGGVKHVRLSLLHVVQVQRYLPEK